MGLRFCTLLMSPICSTHHAVSHKGRSVSRAWFPVVINVPMVMVQVLLLADVDFLVTAGLHERLSEPTANEALVQDTTVHRQVIVLPAFETDPQMALTDGSDAAHRAINSASQEYSIQNPNHVIHHSVYPTAICCNQKGACRNSTRVHLSNKSVIYLGCEEYSQTRYSFINVSVTWLNACLSMTAVSVHVHHRCKRQLAEDVPGAEGYSIRRVLPGWPQAEQLQKVVQHNTPVPHQVCFQQGTEIRSSRMRIREFTFANFNVFDFGVINSF